jgi:PAS domain S-box-containing protein
VAEHAKLLFSGKPIDYEYRIIRPDGSIRIIWDRGCPIENEHGEVKRYVGVGQDVTEMRKAEAAIRESREYLNQIINSIGDPIFVKDQNHRLVLVNDALCSFAGRSREEMIGVIDDPETIGVPFLQQEDAVLNTGKENLSEDNLPDAQGVFHTFMAKKSRLIDKSGNKQVIGILRDITEYKRLEAQFLQSQKMEAVGVLVGRVAHDFNNLLNVINGYAELLLDESDPSDPRCKDINQIREAGQRATVLISQLLAFGRKQIMQPEIFDLNVVIENMSAMLRRLIGEDIELESKPHTNPIMVNADASKIQQVIMNLVVNARDAMPNGGKLTIETNIVEFDESYIQEHPLTKPGSYAMMAISDNGIGMDAATKERIFEPFFTTKDKGKGTGLGLSTVYGIVKQSDGFIWVYSEPQKGTTIKVYIPLSAQAATDSAPEDKSNATLGGSETVLVVEDEASVRSLACRILRNNGHKVLEAADGLEALRISKQYEDVIHLVVSDVVMPEMGGKALVARLEQARPGIRTLFISGYTDNAIVHHGVLDSGIAFLQKPFAVETFLRKVREVLNS